jgi:hypothetical protein
MASNSGKTFTRIGGLESSHFLRFSQVYSQYLVFKNQNPLFAGPTTEMITTQARMG